MPRRAVLSEGWCTREESNLHALNGHMDLNHACMPISPRVHTSKVGGDYPETAVGVKQKDWGGEVTGNG